MPYTNRPSNHIVPGDEFVSDGTCARFVKIDDVWHMSLAPDLAAIVQIGTTVTCDVETKAGRRYSRSGTVVRIRKLRDGTPRALGSIEEYRAERAHDERNTFALLPSGSWASASTPQPPVTRARAKSSMSQSPPSPDGSHTSPRGSPRSSRTSTATARPSRKSSPETTPGNRPTTPTTGSPKPAPPAAPPPATPGSPATAASRRNTSQTPAATPRSPTRPARTSTHTSSRSRWRRTGITGRRASTAASSSGRPHEPPASTTRTLGARGAAGHAPALPGRLPRRPRLYLVRHRRPRPGGSSTLRQRLAHRPVSAEDSHHAEGHQRVDLTRCLHAVSVYD